ncbi:MAG: glycosyltransferase family 2 protein [Gallionellaceae bacterium]|nr:glycosyltransferase family 2 protein [Gallionellaceae bacterium]
MTSMPEHATPVSIESDAMPRVSVIIPAYNAAWCVRRALDSVLVQDYRDFEVIVVDDGSQDDTAAVLAGYGDAARVLSKPNGGLSSARNAGIAAARGEYVAFLDADDWWLPAKLSRQVALMDGQPTLLFCSTTTSAQTPEGRRLPDWRCGNGQRAALECIFAVNAYVAGSGSSVLARRAAFARVGGFDESLRSLEDIDMWMRLAALGDYACIDEPLTVIEKSANSMSGNLDVMRHAAIRVMRKNRALLAPPLRGRFWRTAYAGMLSDYAKWAYRRGRTARALGDLAWALMLAPLSRGRLIISLLLAMLARQQI